MNINKMKRIIQIVLILIIGIILGASIYKIHKSEEPAVAKIIRDTITVTDTIIVRTPIANAEIILRKDQFKIPVKKDSISLIQEEIDLNDTITVDLPVIQRHYGDSTYQAWVSGPLDPRLDSIRIYREKERITITETIWKPPKRWSLGITAGYGYGSRGFQPFIGIGINYSLIFF